MPAKKCRSYNGFTLIELIVAGAVLAFVAAFFVQGIRWVRNSLLVSDKIEILSKFKNSSAVISKELSCAAEFLFPNKVSTEYSTILVFKNTNNEIVAIFLDRSGLLLYNYTTGQIRNLFPMATDFQTRLIQESLIEFVTTFKKDSFSYTVRDRLTPLNSLP